MRRREKNIEREKLVLAPMPELPLQIVEFTRERGRVTISEAIKLRNQQLGSMTGTHYLIPQS